MSILSKDEILQLGGKRKTQTVSIAEWGGDVNIRELTAGEYDKLQLMHYDARQSGKRRDHIRASWVAAYLADENGERIFSDNDVTAIAKMGAKAIDRVFEAGQAFNGLDEDEELVKNSKSETSADSSSS